jgi:hypothetical protein
MGRFLEKFERNKGRGKIFRGADAVAWRLLLLCAFAAALVFVVGYTIDRAPNLDSLNYVIPACIVSYLFGLKDGQRKSPSESENQGEND